MAIAGLVYAGIFLIETRRLVEKRHWWSVRLSIRLALSLRAAIMLLATVMRRALQRALRAWLPVGAGSVKTGTFTRTGELMPGIRW